MNGAVIQWLMSGPDDHELPTLEDYPRRADWQFQGRVWACPARRECLSSALADETLLGVWGGTTERERREMRRGRAVA
jgi:Transcription factor WhiB